MKLNLDSEWQAILADEIEKPYFHDLMERWMKNINFMPVIRPRILFFPLLITVVIR
jgi:uracil-DNA glycosylase